MSASYSHLFHIPTTGLRYFTVYGPWGRPDMAAFLFTRSILEGKEIDVFNHGDMKRNYTYVDDIVNGTIACIDHAPQAYPYHQIYNLGHHKSEKLMDFISILEKLLNKPAKLRLTDKHPGDVKETLADIAPAMRDFDYNPQVDLEAGLAHFVSWYQHYYKSN